jgi:uncharacterized protein
MRMIRSFLFCVCLLLAACSSEPEQPPIVTIAKGKPALWQVTSKDNKGGTAWLFGTVHMLPPDTDWQGPVLDDAIRASNDLVLEVTGLDDMQAVSSIFADMGIRHGLPRLADRIDPVLRAKLAQTVDAASVPPGVLDTMETWAAALTLSSSFGSDMGLSKAAGVERILQLRYTADEKPIKGLESVDQQFGYFDTLPEKEQRIMLAAIVDGAKDNRAKFQKMLDAWMAGDIDNVLTGANEGLLASKLVRETLLDGRNQKCAEAIAMMVDDGKRPFVAVGAGHLVGKTGVHELLTAKGYIVKRIQ